MTIGEVAGYVASALVFMAFYMKSMKPLRIVAILSNVSFIIYAFVEGLLPVLILHLSLFPLNVLRLRQILKLTEDVRESASGEPSLESLLPFVNAKHFKAGDVLFRKGDASHELYYVKDGVIRLPELGKTLGKGETFGEIGLFSPERARLVTAVCETDCELLQMTEDNVRQLYFQNPRFGFHLLRIITRRLVENYSRLLQSARSEENAIAASETDGNMASGEKLRHETREDSESKRAGTKMRRRIFSIYLPALGVVTVLALLLFSWEATYHVQSLLVRDAAVTTWSNVATSPIEGTVRYHGVVMNAPVDSDHVVADVRNEHLSRLNYDNAKIRLDLAKDRVREIENFLEEIEYLETERRDAKSLYADVFRALLDTRIANLQREISVAEGQLRVLQKIASRKLGLANRGSISENEADEAELRVTDLEVEIASLRSDLRDAHVQRKGANDGVFITRSGIDPDWVFDSRMDLKLEKKSTRLELENARADLAVAEAAFAAAQSDYLRLSQAEVTVPPGSVIWSRKIASGATVRAGDPLVEWLDCSILLVDVPLPDVEIPLIASGMEAHVILDGESSVRTGHVLLARGSAATLGREDLVAIGQEREKHQAQVLVDISDERETFEVCPVGRVAFVDFPDIGLLDVVSAWLRL